MLLLYFLLLSACDCVQCAEVAKLVDALDLGSSAARHEGSIPFFRTILND